MTQLLMMQSVESEGRSIAVIGLLMNLTLVMPAFSALFCARASISFL